MDGWFTYYGLSPRSCFKLTTEWTLETLFPEREDECPSESPPLLIVKLFIGALGCESAPCIRSPIISNKADSSRVVNKFDYAMKSLHKQEGQCKGGVMEAEGGLSDTAEIVLMLPLSFCRRAIAQGSVWEISVTGWKCVVCWGSNHSLQVT